MFSFTTLLICLLLGSAVFQLLPRYYEKVRLLKFLQKPPCPLRTCWSLPSLESFRSPRYTTSTLCSLAVPYAPGGSCFVSLYDYALLSAVEARHIDIRSFILTRFYSFTLSHYGSQAPLSTLKPCFAASAPRLSTGCLLDFTGTGLSPACICSAELAHCLCIPNQRSPQNDRLRLVN